MSIGDGANTVVVGLRARAECLARQIVTAYGPKVEVTVGLLPFPPQAQTRRTCHIGEWPHGFVPGLRTVLEVPAQVQRGEFFKGSVHFSVAGPGAITVETSSNFTVYLFQPEGEAPIGTGEGGSMGTGLSFRLVPGQDQKVDAFGGTASCDPALGYALPSGQYRARALIDIAPAEGGVHQFWSESSPIEVVGP